MSRALTLALALAVLLPSSAQAGPWAAERGHGYAKIWVKYLFGFGFNTQEGERESYAQYHELFIASYGEVGLGARVSAWWHTDLLRTFFLRDPSRGRGGRHIGVGDPALGFAWQALQQGRFAFGLRGGVRMPFARGEAVQTVFAREANEEGFEALGELRIGEGAFGVPLSAEVGWAADGWYFAASLGYELRTNGYDDRIFWSAEAGRDFGSFRGRIRLNGAHSIRRGSAPRANSPSGLGNGVSWSGFAIECERSINEHTVIGASIEGGILGLRSQTGGPVVNVFAATNF